ncbi:MULTISPECIES: DUF1048 domain-containing protein [Enterococcus]|uniref:DUF1048 domain-containing protein n=1 Tax=Enterococcus TaxID=1350 RepID=UPI000A8DE110|nr:MULTISPECIES: DUF1048 domain-containing protein [Enterococcus]
MANKIIKNSLDVMEKGLESLKNIKKDKKEYREFLARVKTLPEEYHFVYEKISHYMWGNFGGGDGYDLMAIQTDLLELFEASVAEGKKVLEVTGEDVAEFSDELLRNARTLTENQREKLNRSVQKKINKK